MEIQVKKCRIDSVGFFDGVDSTILSLRSFDGIVKSQKVSVIVIPVKTGIQENQLLMDSRSPIRSRTNFAGVTALETFYKFISFLKRKNLYSIARSWIPANC